MSKAYNIATNLAAYQNTFDNPNVLNMNTVNVTDLNSSNNATLTNLKMSSTSHEWTIKGIDSSIGDSQTEESPDTTDSDSGQLAIYNAANKLWGITEGGYVSRPNQPSFLVYGAPSKNGNIVYNFQIIDHNIGNHYDNSNGKFTAPISGRYLFCASIWATADSNDFMIFYKNNAETVGSHQAGSSLASSASISTVLDLLAGDFVELIVRYSIQSSTPRNNFSGHLIG